MAFTSIMFENPHTGAIKEANEGFCIKNTANALKAASLIL
jgi:hypothetical protein